MFPRRDVLVTEGEPPPSMEWQLVIAVAFDGYPRSAVSPPVPRGTRRYHPLGGDGRR